MTGRCGDVAERLTSEGAAPTSVRDYLEEGKIGCHTINPRRTFDVPLSPGGSPLQRHVWDLIGLIPYGETTTYGDVANVMGDGVTAQQVGAAVSRNPLSLIVACHRVVGRGGKLTGYAGGLARKRYLLDLERDQLSHSDRIPFQTALIPAL